MTEEKQSILLHMALSSKIKELVNDLIGEEAEIREKTGKRIQTSFDSSICEKENFSLSYTLYEDLKELCCFSMNAVVPKDHLKGALEALSDVQETIAEAHQKIRVEQGGHEDSFSDAVFIKIVELTNNLRIRLKD